MIDYLKTLLGLHLGLYTLRLARQLPGWIAAKEAHSVCRNCPVYGQMQSPFADCPYGVSLTVDMGDDFRSRMAQLAQESAYAEFENLHALVRAIFAMNHLLRYAREERLKDDPMEVPRLLALPPKMFDSDFKALLKQIIQLNSDDEEVPPEVRAILDAAFPGARFMEMLKRIRSARELRRRRGAVFGDDYLAVSRCESGREARNQPRERRGPRMSRDYDRGSQVRARLGTL